MNEDTHQLTTLETEFRRVGITWDTFAELDRDNALGSPPSASSFVIALDIPGTLAVLRSLPAGAGREMFIRAFKSMFAEPLQKRAAAAAEAEERKRRGRKRNDRSAGA